MTTLVETKMGKKRANFTSTFIGLTGYPCEPTQFTESPQVELNGHIWSIKLFPGGVTEEHKGFISVFLCNSSTTNVRASFRLSIVNQRGFHNREFNSESIRKFDHRLGPTDMYGEPRMLSKHEARNISNGFCLDDTLIIRAEIVVFSELEQAIVSSAPEIVPTKFPFIRSTVANDIQNLLFDERTSDCVILVQNQSTNAEERLYVHSFIMALRSPVFGAMLQKDRNGIQLLESVSNIIHISDFDVKIIKELVRFMYTDDCDEAILTEDADDLLAVSCKYQVLGLESVCEEHLCKTLTTERVVDVLCLADAFGAVTLKKRCLGYLCHHGKEILTTQEVFEQLGFSLCQEVIKLLVGLGDDSKDGDDESTVNTNRTPQGSPLRGGGGFDRDLMVGEHIDSLHSHHGHHSPQQPLLRTNTRSASHPRGLSL